MRRLELHIAGTVQGVGFRPFVYGAARARGLTGWVRNAADGVHIEVQGEHRAVHDFLELLQKMPPPAAQIERLDVTDIAPTAETEFQIRKSTEGAAPRPCLPADLATCAACEREILAAGDRRYGYPFTNCTACGPRYTIIESLPYDRPRTSMRGFPLCPRCQAEYEDPRDRRFHAQPVCCPVCGPQLRLLAPDGALLLEREPAVREAAARLLAGEILALKGLGGFHFLVLATSAAAVMRLRRRKRRPEKPLAVMFESLDAVRSACVLSDVAAALLCSKAAPIVLLPHHPNGAAQLAVRVIAPLNPYLGVLLPYTPLHRLLLALLQRPLVCTSGNLSEEPICTDGDEARSRLAKVADVFLDHGRPIVRPVDDSVLRVAAGAPLLLRRARGFAPLPLALPGTKQCLLALGAHLKSTITLVCGEQAVVSQHLGDLSCAESAALLERTAVDLLGFFAAAPQAVACDLHPDYASTRLAERLAAQWKVPCFPVQHHHAHVAACVAEYRLRGPVLGLVWDGAGLGTDGTLWGSEALVVRGARCERLGHLRAFRLPGGERAQREPRRAALGALFEILGKGAAKELADLFSARELRLLLGMLAQHFAAPLTTSMGRLFDAVAALCGLRAKASFEGQAAMELEFLAERAPLAPPYPIPIAGNGPFVADWEPLLRSVLTDRKSAVKPAAIAARFHEALAQLAEELADRAGIKTVVLTGGCFQNAHLLSRVKARLAARGFAVYVPRRYPPNDGGISLGQAYVAAQLLMGV